MWLRLPKNGVYPIVTNEIARRTALRSTVTTAPEINDEKEKIANAKPFSEVPGPKGLPIIGTLWTLLKNNGYYLTRFHQLYAEYTQQFGPIFKDKIANMQLVFVTKPEDAAIVFKAEGKYPSRGPITPWIVYREQHKKSKGVLIGEQEEWRKARSIMDKKLLKIKDVGAYCDRMNDVISDFITYIKRKQIEDNLNGELADLQNSLYKWSFETINTVIFNKRLGALDDPPTPIAEKFYNNVCKVLDISGKIMLLPPYYKYVKTKQWIEFCESCDVLFEIGGKLIAEERNRLISDKVNILNKDQDDRHTEGVEFLPYILSRGKLTDDEITGNIIDLMGAGVDTSGNTILWTLYILGKNPDIQQKLYEEVSKVLKDGQLPDSQSLQKMPYLRGVLKESERLYPVIVMLLRVLDKDIVLRGYHIPAKTRATVMLNVMFRDESVFEEATKVKPERWMRSSSSLLQHHPFSFTPFGFGPRMCIGRRVAEQEMQLLIARLISEFQIECRNEEEVGITFRLVASPDQDIRIAFKPRNELANMNKG